ncbi:PhzF family phenazine biosynthesis protein [Providencia huaxiensis]|uniref:PhzF family phenazine biosynthesis protein n=1 Tax=Providencia TaxID=586 RepID=UPI001B36453C|nr:MULTISPECIES: PhzF family phenazine biosynthesis protein [Providencia]EJD6369396.1 PhzF family phenazine biosynthesis protein [Providencia rettgeri]EJD6373152.1 PhzF family phenazine biosynthesis protein [Providencia rettgeri]ELR5032683.1 PhzF family phenazine biosynthesis protein [Providencia rettgeri]ELR5128212.1 PhzF family phenazine biosynthesis protein [Providencia rettgeri]ELR5158813.1 PhzF family phenazine biosynthesis protein [Providencia rettgeri]
MKYIFEQVTVFSSKKMDGNALAVVVGADDLTEEQMNKFAKWTNLSETVFLLKPTTPKADYRVRIYTTEGELPFAGHPTLGSCFVWQQTYGRPLDTIVQECGVGLVTIKRINGKLAFMAPPLIRGGEIEQQEKNKIFKALGLTDDDVVGCKWLDNGPGWLGIELKSVEKLLHIEPDYSQLKGYDIGLCAICPEGYDKQLEVRAFCCSIAEEDPVTGSFNAVAAQWLIPQGKLPQQYTAGQGQCIGRNGLIYVTADDEGIWVAGDVVNCISGTVELD